jgi:hypothetical protein
MHVSGDLPLSLPFYLLKRLMKMSKRIQTHPQSVGKSLFHQGFIKILVLYALRELQLSWNQLLDSLDLEEQGPKKKNVSEKKSSGSKTKNKVSKGSAKSRGNSPVATRTRS